MKSAQQLKQSKEAGRIIERIRRRAEGELGTAFKDETASKLYDCHWCRDTGRQYVEVTPALRRKASPADKHKAPFIAIRPCFDCDRGMRRHGLPGEECRVVTFKKDGRGKRVARPGVECAFCHATADEPTVSAMFVGTDSQLPKWQKKLHVQDVLVREHEIIAERQAAVFERKKKLLALLKGADE